MSSKKSDEKENIPNILKIEHWDVGLPVGDWIGPEPLALFPKINQTMELSDKMLEFRELHIQYHPNSEQHPKIVNWVKGNIPEEMKWLFHGLDICLPQFQNIFFAAPSIHIMNEGEGSEFKLAHPEMYQEDWDDRLDICRTGFIKYLDEIKCSYQFVSENEALDNGMLIMKDYKRPNIIGSHDTSPGTSNPPKKLWKYLTLPKFVSMLQNQSIWFSRPQFFEDPHEFTMDEASQRELFQWKLDSFVREYNRAVVSNRKSYVFSTKALINGLPIDSDGKIEKSSIKLSNLSDILLSSIKRDIQRWQESFHISCWRYSAFDSVAIWNQYASLEEGVAVVVDLDKLRKSFEAFGDIRLAIVEYRNFHDTSNGPMRKNPLTYKDIRYSPEEEARFYFRAILGDLKGVAVPFDLSDVIQEIHLPPNAGQWFKLIIQNLLTQYGFSIQIKESSLGKIPNKF